MIYAGIGARETPPDVLVKMDTLGRILGMSQHTLRSGGAAGADRAFEAGHRATGGIKRCEIWLASSRDLVPKWHAHAASYHPAWHRLDKMGQMFMARNSAVLLGPKLDKPADCVICWTKGGGIVGGTGQALRIAADPQHNIPVFNLWFTHAETDFWAWLATHGK